MDGVNLVQTLWQKQTTYPAGTSVWGEGMFLITPQLLTYSLSFLCCQLPTAVLTHACLWVVCINGKLWDEPSPCYWFFSLFSWSQPLMEAGPVGDLQFRGGWGKQKTQWWGKGKKELLEIKIKLPKWNKLLNADFLTYPVLAKSKTNRFQITCWDHARESEADFTSPFITYLKHIWKKIRRFIEEGWSWEFLKESYQCVLCCLSPPGKVRGLPRLPQKWSELTFREILKDITVYLPKILRGSVIDIQLDLLKSKVGVRLSGVAPNCRTKRKGCSEGLLHLTDSWTKVYTSWSLHVERNRIWVILKWTPGKTRCPQLSIKTIVWFRRFVIPENRPSSFHG